MRLYEWITRSFVNNAKEGCYVRMNDRQFNGQKNKEKTEKQLSIKHYTENYRFGNTYPTKNGCESEVKNPKTKNKKTNTNFFHKVVKKCVKNVLKIPRISKP